MCFLLVSVIRFLPQNRQPGSPIGRGGLTLGEADPSASAALPSALRGQAAWDPDRRDSQAGSAGRRPRTALTTRKRPPLHRTHCRYTPGQGETPRGQLCANPDEQVAVGSGQVRSGEAMLPVARSG